MIDRRALLAGAAAMAAATPARAAYPERPVTMIVPFAAGSGTDTVARIVAQQLGTRLGGSVVVENRAGANGSVAATFVARSEPDGHTLFMTTNTSHSANPSLLKSIPYDPVADFTPVARMGNLPFLLVIDPRIPAKSVAELVAHAKANPGKLTYASGNSTGIVAGATFARRAGIEVLHVPYRSTPPAVTDIIGGRISMMFVDITSSLTQVNAGALRALAVTTAERSKLLPDLPSMQEAGIADFDITSWNGVFGPAKMPAEVVQRLNREISVIATDPELVKKFAEIGFDAFAQTPAQLDAFVRAQLVTWARMIKDAGIEPQ
ncbi:tripartite-type tricarboxylate transporter receptor subunit TctC [Phreatobacter oligotrophus]|uniref:Tripartite-type tricarboxylate transporter receptor subunit TctC n=2 Tax=Phreatobacter oligotrophus TaxID=1122261 RepID=A0A2T4ZED8_9HYPH|nr:tripartite tricarboxylate transporter substrate binding protein [Phreatobacter oligotrophus]PTM60261.1 tripartite-type tricarboxylate transporter receptor subunit TctC [Phreatobacter oligotrophus]